MNLEDEFLNKLNKIERNIKELADEQRKIVNKIKILKSERDDLQNNYNIAKLKNRKSTDEWIVKKFSWSNKLEELLREKFGFQKFRSKQLAAMNATLSKKDVLLVMPTGGGKSLVYQLPCLISGNLTLVVSPLISLIEDQLIALKKFNINAATVNSGCSKEEKNNVHKNMLSGKMNLLYVTPEWVAKSKIFMTYLQKTYDKGLLDRIVIDEVHCCSTWGHDFRPEYGHLSFFKTMFSGVPILGLTATATMQVLVDVQNMLSIPDALIITAPFNRPNLFYSVEQKPSEKESVLNRLETILKKDESGIIYTSTIKESEDIAQQLKNRGLRVHFYHAQLEPDQKRKIHKKWLEGTYKTIVATIAFGMGIDKPDVRFVVHYSVPKSMEGLYQESGRAGRDGKKADCIVMFNLSDFLRNVAMASSKQEEKNNLALLGYCLNFVRCRRSLISDHFEDTWRQSDCDKMCDVCIKKPTSKKYDVTPAYRDIVSLIEAASNKEIKLTLNKLMAAIFQNGARELRVANVRVPKCHREDMEYIVGFLVFGGYLGVDKGFTMYTTVAYLARGSRKCVGKIVMEYNMNLRGFQVVEDENYCTLEVSDSNSEEISKKRRKTLNK